MDHEIATSALQARLAQGERPHLIDVREPDEYAEGRIPGAQLIPLGDLPGRMDELPKGEELIMICRSGNRSGRATRFLRAQGFEAFNMTGGMLAWQGEIERT